jgi:GH35 family endo-1,4-beta-xylanase
MSDIDRRTFLSGVAALAATSFAGCKSASTPKPTEIHVGPTTEEAAGLGSEESRAPVMSDGRPALRVLTVEADGSPLSAERMKTLHVRDMHNDTLPQALALASGRARVELSRDEPIQISCRLNVPRFGEVYCYADNNGRGYSRAANIDFVADAAQTRAKRVRDAWESARRAGVVLDRSFQDRLAAAQKPLPTNSRQARVAAAYENLSHGLHAGEQLAIAVAKHRIAKLSRPRDDFQFGVMVSQWNALGPEYEKRVRELFDFATCSWYTWNPEASAGMAPVSYDRMDGSVNWCLERGITPKNFGYLYMTRGATPEWIRPVEVPAAASRPSSSRPASGDVNTLPNAEPSDAKRRYNERWPYERIRDLYSRVIKQTMARYHGRVPYAEIMNEAHDKANLWGMSHEQVLDMARMAFDSAREGSRTVKRQMNHCCMWGEYAKNRNADGSRRWTPYRFIRDCFANGVDYEVIGLQLYYPQNDLFEIDRMLERFTAFGKPIHITEMATASRDGLDPGSMRPKTYAPGWHGPWSQAMQADWSEAIFTLCYSKPLYLVVGWWDFADKNGRFWPFGGMLDENLQPKEVFTRLLKLKQSWGLAKKA